MQINRDNYENFFLMYTDNELCAADRKAVEDFAAANADLQQELEILMSTVLPADEINFEDKGELLRPIPVDAILLEKLLLKADNELPEPETASLNELIATDANVKAEFALLNLAKLDPSEKIIFEDRQSLYREEKDRPVIPMFFRLAAAAVLVGFGLFFGASLLKNNKQPVETPGIASTQKTNTGTTTRTAPVKKDPDPQILVAVTTPAITVRVTQKNTVVLPVTTIPDKNTAATNVKKNAANTKNAPDNNMQPANNNIVQQQPVQNRNNLPQPVIIHNEQVPILAQVELPKKITTPDNNIISPENTYAQAASLNENDKSENKILYMDEDNVKRSRIGGFFRKVKRIAERTAKIKGGGSVSIAGFELAAK